MKLGHAFLAIAAMPLLATGDRADSIPASSYAIDDSLTIPGNGTFTETIDFAFTLDLLHDRVVPRGSDLWVRPADHQPYTGGRKRPAWALWFERYLIFC